MSAALVKANRERVQNLNRIKTDSAKRSRIAMKQARREEHEARKQWVKSQAIQHDYGSSDEECASDQEADGLLSSADSVADGVVVTSSVTKCKCGSVTHKRTNHRDCPLNKQGSSAAVPSASTATVPSTSTATCKCDSLSHKWTSHRDCPLNQHHQV